MTVQTSLLIAVIALGVGVAAWVVAYLFVAVGISRASSLEADFDNEMRRTFVPSALLMVVTTVAWPVAGLFGIIAAYLKTTSGS